MPSGRHPQPPALRVHMPVPRRTSRLPDPPVPLSRDAGSPMVDAAAIATLRADLHELAAELHELAAAIHEWRADEHGQALRHSLGDPIHHQLQADLRRTAAAAERASAQKERELRSMTMLWSAMRAEQDRGHADADRHRRNAGRVDVAGPGDG